MKSLSNSQIHGPNQRRGLLLHRWIALLLALLCLLLFSSNTFSAPEDEPQTFLYGVTFTDDEGKPLALDRNLHTVTFKLWPSLTGGTTPDYSETFLEVEVTNGFLELNIGLSGFPAGGLPDLTVGRFVEITVRVDPTDPETTFTPRTELPTVPLARNARQATFLGPFTADSLLTLINDGDHSRYTDSEAVAAAIGESSILKKNESATIGADLTLSTSAILIVSTFGSSSTTRMALRNQGQDLMVLDSLGNLTAQTFHGDGSLLANVIHLGDSQVISGPKTFTASGIHFQFEVRAGNFSGDGTLITSVVHTFGGEQIQGIKTFEDQVELQSNLHLNGQTSALIFQPSSDPAGLLTRVLILDSSGAAQFSVDAMGNVTGRDIYGTRFIGDGNSLTNLIILTDYLLADTVTSSKIQNDAVTSGKISDLTISSSDIGDQVVTSSHLADGAVTSGKISGSITLPADLTVTAYLSRDVANVAYGTASNTHVNLGNNSATGASGSTRSYISIAGGLANTAEGNFSNISGGRGNLTGGHYSAIPGGRYLSLLGDNSLGFNATSAPVTVNESEVVVFMGVRTGLNTTVPQALLDIISFDSLPLLSIRTGDLDAQQVLRITSQGMIGIRTLTPQHELEINGTLKLSKIILGTDTRTAFGVTSGAFSIDTVNLEQVASYVGGPVGIGTTMPHATLTVQGSLARDVSSPLLGNLTSTHVNLGIASTSGSTSDLSEHISIGGGILNTAAMSLTVVAGGKSNQALATAAAILGGQGNLVSGAYGVAVGGLGNSATSTYASLGGGSWNTAAGSFARIGGGERNFASGKWSSIGAGKWNTANGDYSTIGGGRHNWTPEVFASVQGGDWNTAAGEHSLVGGGLRNMAVATGSLVLGGSWNLATKNYSSVVGGSFNLSTGAFSFLGGGSTNTAQGWYTSVGGGTENTAAAHSAAIFGGEGNSATETAAFVGGGFSNHAQGAYSVVVGGNSNQAAKHYSSVLGGANNQADGLYSTIAGGRDLSLGGDSSFGFSAISASQVVTLSSVAVFLGVSMGINTTNPQEALHVVGSLVANNFQGSGDLSFEGSLSRDSSNLLLGSDAQTHVNLAQSSTTGRTDTDISYPSIGGGLANTAAGDYSVVAGGLNNTAWSTGSVVGGGVANQVLDSYVTISGGLQNTATGIYTTLGGGLDNTASGTFVSLLGGSVNTATADYVFLGGGWRNKSSGNYSVLGGGRDNQIDDAYGTISGGEGNTLEGSHATISGGNNNSTNGTEATVSGGGGNAAAATGATISGGQSNQIFVSVGAYGAIGGGRTNTVGASYGVVAGGLLNQAMGAFSSIAGGQQNTASGLHATILGGAENSAWTSSTVAGGSHNLALGTYSVISGGQGSFATGSYSSISGGQGHYVTASYSSIAGGDSNSASASWAAIGGGELNEVIENYGAIAGGFHNLSMASYASIGGGDENTAAGAWSTISGGRSNSSLGNYAAVIGGQDNDSTGNHSAVLGGENNSNVGNYSTIAGGSGNSINADYSAILGGRNLTIDGQGSFGLNGTAQSYVVSDASVFAMMGVKAAVGSTSPQAWLEVIGDGSSPTLRILSTSGTPAILLVSSTGNVGIATDNPSELFEVQGNIKAQGFIGDAANLVFSGTQTFSSVYVSTNLTVEGPISADGSNKLEGANASTQVNLGRDSITGTSGGLGSYASVLGGRFQTATADFSTVVGGSNNQASNTYTGVFAGHLNTAEDVDAVVLGGLNNTATGDQAGILAGESNVVEGTHSVVVGGQNLTVSGSNSFGFNADSTSRTISGNKVVAFLGGVQVGINENTPSEALDVSGNVKATGFIGDASTLTFPSDQSFTSIAASGNLTVSGDVIISGFISKDPANTVGSSTHVNLGEGSNTNGTSATVGGGENNQSTQAYTTVAGGQNNTASGSYAAVAGGRDNTASGSDSAVLGGKSNSVGGNRSTIAGGQNMTLSGNDSFAFSASGSTQIVNSDNVAVFLSVNMGIGTTDPQSALQVSSGGLCVETAGACSGKNAGGTIYANTTTVQQADYAEYFPSEEKLQSGDIAGLNRVTGKVRKYRAGDSLVGVISTKPGIVGGANRDPRTHALVAILGQVPISEDQVRSEGGWILTIDGKPVGLSLANDQVYLALGQGRIVNMKMQIEELQAQVEIQKIKARVQEKRYEALTEEIKVRLNEIEKHLSH